MGQKTNPISNRIGITRGWDSNWVGGNYAEKIAEDYEIRKYLSSQRGSLQYYYFCSIGSVRANF